MRVRNATTDIPSLPHNMKRTGTTNLPLHGGSAPAWLFKRMTKLSGAISEIIIGEFGTKELINRLADPYFFQSLSCVVGFDWHSSGTTTTLCGALKESLNRSNLGIKIAGGKGRSSRKTPEHIQSIADEFSISSEKLTYASKITAKIDNALIQDNYQLYHHCFILDEKGDWTVIQQGMYNRYARRYHWAKTNNFIEEHPICDNKKQESVLDMTAEGSKEARQTSLDIVKDNPKHLEKYIRQSQTTLTNFDSFTLPPNHNIINMKKKNLETLKQAYELQPKDYEELIATRGIGPKTIRSLALISDIIYGTKASWKDPVKYSFAHGGKDGIPYPVDRPTYDCSIKILKNAIRQAKLGEKDRLNALERINKLK